jgi:hypothetical protein
VPGSWTVQCLKIRPVATLNSRFLAACGSEKVIKIVVLAPPT